MEGLRTLTLPLGLLVFLLGIGNWITGEARVAELEARLAVRTVSPVVQRFRAFPNLTARTNASLLRSFREAEAAEDLLRQKLDFYLVIGSGGRMATVLGLLLLGVGLAQWWSRRGRPVTMPPTPPTGAPTAR